jgi:hypothetical protein
MDNIEMVIREKRKRMSERQVEKIILNQTLSFRERQREDFS